MKTYTLSFFSCLFACLLNSCGIVNNTNYLKLADKDKRVFYKTNFQQLPARVNYKDSFKVYEINSQAIFNLSQSSKRKVWVHFFAPWCNSVSQQDLEKLQAVQQRFNNNLILMLVSTSYDYQYLADLVINSKLNLPIYVLDGSLYGTGITKSQQQFYREISHTSQTQHFDDYLIEDDKLIYAHPWKLPIDSFFVKLQVLAKQ